MKQNYEKIVTDAIETVKKILDENCREAAADGSPLPGSTRTPHEVYGIAAEQMALIHSALKTIRKSTDELLSALPGGREEAAALCTRMAGAAVTLVRAAAVIQRATEQLADCNHDTENQKAR